MSPDFHAQQDQEWSILYDRIREVLQQFGEEDQAGQRKDYLLVDDNLGLWQHRIETNNLEMVRPVVVKRLQNLLIGYPNWEIVVALGDFGGLVISEDEIIDDLSRENLPKECQAIEYEGSRPQDPVLRDLLRSSWGGPLRNR